MTTPVTTDLAVLKAWPKVAHSLTSTEVAAALELTVFQITARLKAMEGRGYVARDKDGCWIMTPSGKAERDNPSPSVSGASRTMRAKDRTGAHSGPPDDAQVPRVKLIRTDWAPSEEAVRECHRRLPEIQRQLAAYQSNPRQHAREILALQTEFQHCRDVIRAGRKGKWTSRTTHDAHGSQTTYIAPDMREYVFATANEVADLIIESPVSGIPPARLRLYITSAVAREAKRITKEQEARNARILQDEAEEVVTAEESFTRVRGRGDTGGDAARGRKKEAVRRPDAVLHRGPGGGGKKHQPPAAGGAYTEHPGASRKAPGYAKGGGVPGAKGRK